LGANIESSAKRRAKPLGDTQATVDGASNRSADTQHSRTGIFDETASKDASTLDPTGRGGQAKDLATAERSEQVRAMRQQLKTKMADFTARSVQQQDGVSKLAVKPDMSTLNQQSMRARLHTEKASADEPVDTKTVTKIASMVGDATTAKMETVDGTASTLRTAPVVTAEAPAPVAERIVQHIERVMAQSQRQMTISMGELGEVRISMQRATLQNGGLHVVLEATDARTSQLLQGQLTQLNDALQQRGYADAVVDVREADADSAGLTDNQHDHHQEDTAEEENLREAEHAARKRMQHGGRENDRKGVTR